MAEKSQPFMWKLYGITERLDPRKRCRECGKHPLTTDDVAEDRTRYGPGGGTDFLCKDCKRKQLDAAIAKNRKELGLS